MVHFVWQYGDFGWQDGKHICVDSGQAVDNMTNSSNDAGMKDGRWPCKHLEDGAP